ncbi:MAG: family 16 glycoside hydrolase [Planctomycetota bacterium]
MRTWSVHVIVAASAALAGCGVNNGPTEARPAPSATRDTTGDASGDAAKVARAPVARPKPAKPADAPLEPSKPPEPPKPPRPPEPPEPPKPPAPADFRAIFDGKTLAGWKAPDMGYWSVEDGAITARGTPEKPVRANQFLVWQLGELDDFELNLQYKITGSRRANSGVQIRSRVQPDGHVAGYQADIDFAGQWAGALYDERGRGVLARRGQKAVIAANGKITRTQLGDARKLFDAIKKEDWNEYHITARGTRIVLRINGEVMSEVIDESEKDQDLSGRLALQLHSGPPMTVQFRDIRLKRLRMSPKKKIVLVAGPRSHGYGGHEHNAGWLLLARLLNENMPSVHATVYTSGWPKDPTAFDNADAIALFSDGGGRQPALPHLAEIDKLAKKGVGIAFVHYATTVPKEPAGRYFLDWIGGYYETHWSVNPFWDADFKKFPDHPITRGVRPFTIKDEWYYHMRFREGMQGVTPILTAVPPDSTRKGRDGAHSGNPHVRARMGMPEHVAWAYQGPTGRGFGFTGGHWHWSWGHDDFRKVMLNALVWIAGAEVPADGVPSPTPTVKELEADQDYDKKRNWQPEKIRQMIERWNRE